MSQIELLFPTPIMVDSLGRTITADELKFIQDNIVETISTGSTGQYSRNDHILDSPELNNIKNIVVAQVQSYIDTVHKPMYKLTPYLTQSWILVSDQNDNHQPHIHPNSFLSGVVYISTNIDDSITFFSDSPRLLAIETEVYDKLNSSQWWLPVQENSIIIFPSQLTHTVSPVTGPKPRISIPFNTFVRGKLGGNGKYTELILT